MRGWWRTPPAGPSRRFRENERDQAGDSAAAPEMRVRRASTGAAQGTSWMCPEADGLAADVPRLAGVGAPDWSRVLDRGEESSRLPDGESPRPGRRGGGGGL